MKREVITKKSKQLTIFHYGRFNPLNSKNLVMLELWHQPAGITKLEKFNVNVYLDFSEDRNEDIFQYRHGLISLDIYKAISELINEGYIDVVTIEDKKLYVLTEKGLRYLEYILPKLREHPLHDRVIDEIEALYFKPTSELAKMAYKKAKHLRYFTKYIGEHKITYIFDWSEYGDGSVKTYHLSMLFAFAHYEDYFMKIRTKLPEITKVSVDRIREVMYSDELLEMSGKKKFVLLPEIFQKRDPSSLNEDKEEGKNYIANLWMIVEAINIFHVLAGIAPNIDDLGTICLKDIFFGKKTNFKTISKRELRILKEKTLRNDLKKLIEWKIIEPVKYSTNKKEEVRYKLTAKRYVDYYLNKEFRVADREALLEIYNNKIKPIVKQKSLI